MKQSQNSTSGCLSLLVENGQLHLHVGIKGRCEAFFEISARSEKLCWLRRNEKGKNKEFRAIFVNLAVMAEDHDCQTYMMALKQVWAFERK